MSRVTDVMISVGTDEEAGVEAVSFWMANDAPRSDDRIEGGAGHHISGRNLIRLLERLFDFPSPTLKLR